MFGVGWTEMLVVGIVALVVIGPKDLPVVMARLGKVVAQIRRMGSEFQREINKTTGLDTITDLRRSITEPLKQTAAEITREFNKTTTTGETVPSGVIAPTNAAAESVVDEIHTKVGMSPATPVLPMAPPVMTGPKPVESPAPAEAMPPAPKPRKPRAKKAAVVAAPAETAAAAAPAPAAVAATPAPKKPRPKRTPKPKADA